MFKIPNKIPNRFSSAEEWADYMEYQALKARNRNGISFYTHFRPSKLVSDEIEVDGTEDENEGYNRKLDDIASEISRRMTLCKDRYPFELVNRDYGLKFISRNNTHHLVYRYLLLATRHNMLTNRVHAGIDGALLFEELCAEVVEFFFGKPINVKVFGTSNNDEGTFRERLQLLVNEIKEGGKIHQHNGYRPQDDKIDIVFWKGFPDRKSSQLIAYGQCKTGTHWQDELAKLDVTAFNHRWLSTQMAVLPIKIFFCAQYFPCEIWEPKAYHAGVIFDRFRILTSMPRSINVDLRSRIFRWTTAAESFERLTTLRDLARGIA